MNIYDKEKADRFVKIFGKMNGSNVQPARMAKRRQGFIGSSFICCRKMRDQRSFEVANGAVKVGQMTTGQGRRKGIERQRGKGTNCRAQINYKLFKCTNKHWLEDEGTMVAGVFDFKDQYEGDSSCFKLQVKLDYDHNHEMTSCDAWNFLEVYQETKNRYFELLGTTSRVRT